LENIVARGTAEYRKGHPRVLPYPA